MASDERTEKRTKMDQLSTRVFVFLYCGVPICEACIKLVAIAKAPEALERLPGEVRARVERAIGQEFVGGLNQLNELLSVAFDVNEGLSVEDVAMLEGLSELHHDLENDRRAVQLSKKIEKEQRSLKLFRRKDVIRLTASYIRHLSISDQEAQMMSDLKTAILKELNITEVNTANVQEIGRNLSQLPYYELIQDTKSVLVARSELRLTPIEQHYQKLSSSLFTSADRLAVNHDSL